MNQKKNPFLLFVQEIRTYLETGDIALLSGAGVSLLVVIVIAAFFLPPAGLIFIAVLMCTAVCFVLLLYRRTARSKFENKIKNTELEAVIGNMRDGVVVYDVNFRILNINRAAEELFGISRQEIAGMFITPELVKNPHLRIFTEVILPSLAPSINTLSGDGWPQIIDIAFEEPRLELHTILNKIVGEGGHTIGFLKLITDTTREKAILQSKSDFIAVAAHQLRTPMTALSWIFETIQKNAEGEKEKDAALLASIHEGYGLVQRSLKIINDLLDTAQIEEGRFGFKQEEVDVADLLQSVIAGALPYADQSGVSVRFLTPQSHYTVFTDPGRLGISISNFIDNAIKYNNKEGSVTVRTELSPDKNFVVVSVSDTGIGIPKEDREKLSEKFYRGTQATRLEPNGSGLGVYIAKNIIERLGGTMSVESEVGRGTTISFTIPIKKTA